ncbi:MAG: hypothetical protein AAFX85_14320, partial [Pseudomonadota bacterium]
LVDEENIIDKAGEPYIVFTMGRAPTNGTAADIWIASPFAQRGCHYRRVSDDTLLRRTDLDSLTIPDATTWVYFQDRTLADEPAVLRRAFTGL